MIDARWQAARRILAVRLDNLGDVLVTTPAIHAIRASLPAAQNLFIIAGRYDAATALVRDIILATTFGSLPVVFIASLLLH